MPIMGGMTIQHCEQLRQEDDPFYNCYFIIVLAGSPTIFFFLYGVHGLHFDGYNWLVGDYGKRTSCLNGHSKERKINHFFSLSIPSAKEDKS